MFPVTSAHVKVMRSYDYCHFEVTLTGEGVTLDVDALRKDAARLADKAVNQYKIAKACQETKSKIRRVSEYKFAITVPEGDRTPYLKAVVKYHEDEAFRSQFEYDYDDGWEEPSIGED